MTGRGGVQRLGVASILEGASFSGKLRELDIKGFIQLIVYTFLGRNTTVLDYPQFLDKRIL